MKKDINFIITCFNKEAFWPYLHDIILSYKSINPHIAFCYNGTQNLKADFHCANRGKQRGEADLIVGGVNHLRGNKVDSWIKLSVNRWLLDEGKILEIFKEMEKIGASYAGCPWDNGNHFSSDIMFVKDTSFDFWHSFVAGVHGWIRNDNVEGMVCFIAKRSGSFYMIPERSIEKAPGKYRLQCDPLGWTMQNDLQKNLDYLKQYREKNDANTH